MAIVFIHTRGHRFKRHRVRNPSILPNRHQLIIHSLPPVKIKHVARLRVIWNVMSKGEETSETTNSWACHIWKLHVPVKIKHFSWRFCSDSLPTRLNLYKRKIISSPVCLLCGSDTETALHALRDCNFVKQVWVTYLMARRSGWVMMGGNGLWHCGNVWMTWGTWEWL